MSEEKPLQQSDFPTPIPERLLAELNKARADIRKLELEARFCREHAFPLEAQSRREAINAAMDVYVGVCNALGKVF